MDWLKGNAITFEKSSKLIPDRLIDMSSSGALVMNGSILNLENMQHAALAAATGTLGTGTSDWYNMIRNCFVSFYSGGIGHD